MAGNKFRREARHYRRGDEPYLRALDRNDRARILYLAEALDRRTRAPGQHGGVLKRTGLAVLKALVCRYANLQSGQCDPSAEAIAIAAGVSRSIVFVALDRLEAAGIVQRFQRLTTFRKAGIWHTEQTTNAYSFNFPTESRPDEGDLAAPLFSPRHRQKASDPESRNQPGTITLFYKSRSQNEDLSTGSLF
jgi:DNA-binding MarR family transcriptional regulator